ncbi:MAG: hypothetical protein Q6370_010600 [Candidatus Sigynarchaeota archaeon]
MPRIKSFRDWMLRNFTKDELAEIARYGADAGWRGLTYTRDIAKLFDTYGDEIWDLVYEDARDFGARNVLEFLAQLPRAVMAETLDTFKVLLVWYAAERIAQEVAGRLR